MSGLLSRAEEFAITVNARVTLPRQSILDRNRKYVPAVDTDVRKTWDVAEPDFNDDDYYRTRRQA